MKKRMLSLLMAMLMTIPLTAAVLAASPEDDVEPYSVVGYPLPAIEEGESCTIVSGLRLRAGDVLEVISSAWGPFYTKVKFELVGEKHAMVTSLTSGEIRSLSMLYEDTYRVVITPLDHVIEAGHTNIGA